MHVSIIIPCRNYTLIKEKYPDTNLKGINDALTSVLTNTANLNEIEIQLKLDDDDPIGIEFITSNWLTKLPIKVEIMPGRWRRTGLAHYTNKLAEKSTGEFIWWWSDEVVLIRKNWDTWFKAITEPFIGKICYILLNTQNAGASYPCLSKEWVRHLGCFTKYIALDSFNNFISEYMKNKRMVHTQGYTLSLANHYEIFPIPTPIDNLTEFDWPQEKDVYAVISKYSQTLDKAIAEFKI